MPQLIPTDQELDENGLPRYLYRNSALVNSIPQPTIQPQIPAIPQQINTPPVNIQEPSRPAIHIQAAPPMPAQAAQEALKPPDYYDPQYRNSKLRTVLNAIAGGFAGAAGGPKTGMEVGAGLRDMKFNRAMQDFETKQANYKTQRASEQERLALPEKETTLQTQRETAETLAGYRNRMAGAAETRATTGAAEQKSKDAMRLYSQKYQQWKMDNPKLDDLQFIYSLPEDEQTDALALHKQMMDQKQKDLERIQGESKARSVGTSEGIMTPVGQQAAAVTAGAKSAATTQANINVKTAPANIKKEADLQRAMSLATLTTNEKDTIRGAQIALQALPDIKGQLPTASDKIFGNRWQEFMTGKLGNDPEFAPLRTNIGMLQTLVAKLHVGSRGSVHILNHFMTLFNAKEMTRDTLSSSINELEKWLVRYSKAPTGTEPWQVPDEEMPAIKVNGREIK